MAGWLLTALAGVALVCFPLLPKRYWNLTEQSQFNRLLITDKNKGGQTEAKWLSEQRYQCVIQPQTQDPFCAMQINLKDEAGRGRDLSAYDRLRIQVRLKGPGTVLRLHMRVFDPRFSKPGQMDSAKFQGYVFSPGEQGQPLELPLAGFSVADWWVREFAPRREFAQLDFANVVMIGIDLPAPTQPGTYDIELLALEFIGDRLQLTHVLVVFILLWCALVSFYLWMGIWQVVRQWQRERPAWQELHESISGYKPTADFRRYNNFRDRATQCLDHTGLVLALVELLQQGARPRLPFVVLELVASPLAGRFTGQSLPHEVQVEFAERLKRYTKDDIGVVARWRGPCFIVLATTTKEHLMVRLDLLRAALRLNPLTYEDEPVYTDLIISSGLLNELEQAFEQLLKAWWRLHWRRRAGLVGMKPQEVRPKPKKPSAHKTRGE